jgi:photosystem II stability/assembly factor-like uncharacterized protein
MQKLFILIFFVVFTSPIIAQEWVEKMTNPENQNFYEIQTLFNNYWKDRPIEKGQGYKQFKRWEHHWENRIKPDGTFYEDGLKDKEWNRYLQSNGQSRNIKANWQPLGPNYSPGGYAGLGRIASIAFHPTDQKTIWVGAAGGGLWKSTDGGVNWKTTTDTFTVLGISGIIIDKANPDVMYVATGDGDAGDNNSIGVLKSIDGGVNWAKTGLVWTTSNGRRIRKLIQDPDDPNMLLAATTAGIYQTTDAGVTWKSVKSGNYFDIEANPKAATKIFYASNANQLFKSSDNGATWTTIQTITGANRIAIAIAPSNDSTVYALCSKSSDSGLLGVYKSTNSGNSYVLQSDKPNILSGSKDGSSAGGQGWYDLIITVDPLNANVVYTGGVTTWKSTDGGLTWALNSFWYNISGVPAVHADKHVFEWQNSITLWEGNDGGVYRTTNGGTSWTYLSSTMEISQMYRMSVSQKDAKAITGLQDNGTKLKLSNGNWSDVLGGDGMQCAIHPTNPSVMYGCIQNGALNRSNNGGSNWVNIQNNIPGKPSGAWITPFALHASNPNLVVAGYKEVYKSNNQGGSWVAISKNLSNSNLNYLFIAPSDSNYIYAAKSDSIYKTRNGGATWVKYPTPGSISNFCIHPKNPEILWAVRSNYSANQKVYKSKDGGATWTNISGSLPNIPANSIEYQVGTNDGLYVGMDMGVFYKDSTMADWVLFADGLPNAEVTDMEIKYDEGKIYASTYGRGLWKSDWYSCTVDSTSFAITNCNDYTWGGIKYDQSGTYTRSFKNKFGCDSIVSLNLTLLPTSTNNLSITACESYTLNKQTYTQSGSYVQKLKNSIGCDSTINLELTIHSPSSSEFSVTACETYSWFGKDYTDSGNYTQNLVNAVGCDSTITLHLTIGKNENKTIPISACTAYSWNGITYNKSGLYTQKLTSHLGCDSTVTINLDIDTIINVTLDISSCNGYLWEDTTFTNSGQFFKQYKSSTGCDSNVVLNLTIYPSLQTQLKEAACEKYVWNDKTYTKSEIITQYFTSVNGCDSIVVLDLTILPKSTITNMETFCGSYTWNGVTYTTSGTYSQTFKNQLGCDSIVTVELTILNNSTNEETLSSCNEYNWFGVKYYDSGTYTTTIPNSIGCDSILTLHLNILKSTESEVDATACQSYTWFGKTYNSSGTYQYKTRNAAGCDSTITLNLTILSASETTITASSCDAYVLNNQTYSTTGVYTQKLKNSLGCDSILTLNLKIIDIDTSILVTSNSLKSNAVGATFQWINCDGNIVPIVGEKSNAIIPTKTGYYAVVIEDNGCIDTSNCYFFVVTGVNALDDHQISIFPNPTTGLITLKSQLELRDANIKIFNNLGQLVVHQTNLTGKEINIDLSSIVSGVYFIQMSDQQKQYLAKVIKE